MTKPHSDGDLRFSKTGAQEPHTGANVRGQDNVDCELYGSYFTNAVLYAVFQVGEKTWNLRKVTLELAYVVYHAVICRAVS